MNVIVQLTDLYLSISLEVSEDPVAELACHRVAYPLVEPASCLLAVAVALRVRSPFCLYLSCPP